MNKFGSTDHEKAARERLDENGLARCGCGGKAKCLHHITPDGDYAVKCGKCKIMTDWFNSPEDAIKAFNTAMRCAGESWRWKDEID